MSLLKSYGAKAEEDKTMQQVGAVVAGVMCFGLAAYALPSLIAGGAAGGAAAGSAAVVAEGAAAGSAAAIVSETAIMGAGAAAAEGVAAGVVAEGAAAALGAEAAIAGSAIAGASAVALKEGARSCEQLIDLLSLQMKELETEIQSVQDAESNCDDLLRQLTLVSRDYSDAEAAFEESDLEDVLSFTEDAERRLTQLKNSLDVELAGSMIVPTEVLNPNTKQDV